MSRKTTRQATFIQPSPANTHLCSTKTNKQTHSTCRKSQAEHFAYYTSSYQCQTSEPGTVHHTSARQASLGQSITPVPDKRAWDSPSDQCQTSEPGTVHQTSARQASLGQSIRPVPDKRAWDSPSDQCQTSEPGTVHHTSARQASLGHSKLAFRHPGSRGRIS